MIQWENYKVAVHLYKALGLKLTVEYGKRTHKNYSTAGDRTEEILSAVMEYFKQKFERQQKENPEKKYIGVSSNYGKLLYVPKGYSIQQNKDGSIKITPPKPPQPQRRVINYEQR